MSEDKEKKETGEKEETSLLEEEEKTRDQAPESKVQSPKLKEAPLPEGVKSAEEEEKDEVPSLKERLLEKERLAEEYLSHLQRLQADFENYKKRSQKERESLMEIATEILVLKLLPVVDNLERAINSAKDLSVAPKGEAETKKSNNLQEGMNLIYRQMNEFLEEAGVTKVSGKGEVFDPAFHEAVAQEETDKYPEGTILEELQKGYLLNSKLIRPARVKIAKKTEDSKMSQEPMGNSQ